ncbi:pyridoxal-phosphate dependent enzyme [Tatumella citrea]|uniref:L-serine ammonia-lyase n=1 Tax=Tatumella citrea TaxID=53336 RepID=A0A1Y0L8F9_TATCI|nr:pyridoxal-phosphate dependent enzyme [Tatumella citrea]ARU94324.1 serine dehydratase [Tatumella citrea]ARU98364.1 serine dehydratase [Tatumella citrea]
MLSIKTPLIESLPLSQSNNARVWLKMEALQPCGSFKLRGVGHACETFYSRGARRFISSSGGNAGLAVAYAGRKLGVPVIVFVPETTSQRAKDLLALEGASVQVAGSSWAEANQAALALAGENDAFIHPFDDPLLWEGHATLIDEVVADGVIPDAVVLSVGGGGLLSGVDAGLKRNGLADVPIYAAETSGMASYQAALQAGKPVSLPELSGVATSLGARQVCDHAWQISRQRPVIPCIVTDKQAVDACLVFADDHRVVTEPACGAALAVLYSQQLRSEGLKNILLVVCGGATATLSALQQFRG